MTAALILAAMVWAAAGPVSEMTLGTLAGQAAFAVVNVLPCIVLAVAVWVTDAKFRGGLWLLGASAAMCLGLVVYFLSDFVTSESSTSALIFVVLPFFLLAVAGVGVAVTALVGVLTTRRQASPTGAP